MPKHTFKAADFFVIRTPLLPFHEFASLVEPGESPSHAQIGARMRERLLRPLLDESVQVASRSLHSRMKAWRPDSTATKDRKSAIALLKYFSRMAYRCTPFGLLAGVSWAPLELARGTSEQSSITLAPAAEYRRHCRLDTGVLVRVNRQLMSRPEVRSARRYFPNPTIARHGDRWQYMEAVGAGGSRRFQLSTVERTPYLDALLELCERDVTLSFAELSSALRSMEPDASDEDAGQFIHQLIDNGLLLSDLEPLLTLGDPLERFLSEHGHDETDGAFAQLRKVHNLCRTLNTHPMGHGRGLIEAIEGEIRVGLDQPHARDLLQIDLHKPLHATQLAPELIEHICAGVEALLKLSPRISTAIDRFKTEFARRYGDAEIPLLEALDPDIGLGFGPVTENLPLLDGTRLIAAAERSVPTPPWALQATQILMREFEHSCREGSSEIVLDDARLAALSSPGETQVPDSFYVVTSMHDGGPGGERRIAIKATGMPGTSSLSRFCTADEALTQNVRKFIQEEEALSPDMVCAEIVHLPDGRYGNVIARPQLRSREIPIFGRSSVPPADQILLRDILVSVSDGRVRLKWARTGQLIAPKLTSAHNTEHISTPVYRFFGALEIQDGYVSPFRWPPELINAKHLPRVVYGRCILSPQRWSITQGELAQLRSAQGIEALRKTLKWPRFVEFVQGSNALCVDLDNPLSVACLSAETSRSSRVTIREAFVPGANGFVRGPEGAFCHEMVIPFVRRRTVTNEAAVPRPPAVSAPQLASRTTKLPGSEWLFLKIYAGPAAGERILGSHLPALLDRLSSQRLIRSWFFLRYRDPDPHVRVRMQGDAAVLWTSAFQLVSEFLQQLRDLSLASRVCIDTYEPETERYGGPDALGISENIFHADSECALRLISGGHLVNPADRWKRVLYAVDRFWRAACSDEDARSRVYRKCSGVVPYMQRSAAARDALNRKYRDHRSELERLVFSDAAPAEVQSIVEIRSARLRELLPQLQALEGNALKRSFEEIMHSHVHLSVNRLCVGFGTAQERVIYDLLARLYASRRARFQTNSRPAADALVSESC